MKSAASSANASVLATPSLLRRMACFVYEGLLLFGIGLIPGAVGALLEALIGPQHAALQDSALRALAFLIYAVYFTWFWSARGQTLPMQTWSIRVVTTQGQPLTRLRAFGRFMASAAWFAPATVLSALNHWSPWQTLGAVGIGVLAYALLALVHPQHQFWHDALAGTRLIVSTPKPSGAAAIPT